MPNHPHRPLRVALVAASPDIVGGQGVQAQALVEALRHDGHEVSFIPIDVEFAHGLGWVKGIRGVRTVLNELLYSASLTRLASVDVVHAFSASYWSFLLAPVPAMLVGRLFNARVVLHYHSGEADDHLSHWGPFVHPWLRLAHDIVVPSAYLARVFAGHGYSTRVIPNIVDVDRFVFRERTPLRPRVVSTRNLDPYYRVDLAIDAFARFKTAVPAATLTIAGYGREEARLREHAAPLGASVRFVGKVAPDAMPALLDDHDLFLNASTLDNQPVSILEAFAAGLPVVSSDVGDIPAMVRHDQTGFLAPAGDAAALSEGLASAWRNPDAARARARRAAEEIGKFSWPAVRSAWADTYRTAELDDDQRVNQIAIANPR